MKFIGKGNAFFDTLNREAFAEATELGWQRIPGGTDHRFPKFGLIKPNLSRAPIDFIYNIMGVEKQRAEVMKNLFVAAHQRTETIPKTAAYSCGDNMRILLKNRLRDMNNESFKPMDNQNYILVYDITDSSEFLNISETLDFLAKRTKGSKFILVGLHSKAVSTTDAELNTLAKKYNAQHAIIDLTAPAGIQPLKQMIEQPCKDIQAKYDQENNDLAFTKAIAKQPIYFTHLDAQKFRRNWQIFGIVLAAIFFTPLSLFATIPLFIRAQKQNPIKELEITSKDYKAVKQKRKEWYKQISSELNEADLKSSNLIKPKKIKDEVNCGEKLHYYMDKAQYDRFKLFEDHDLDYLKKNVTLDDIKQSKEESLEIMRGLQLTI